MYNCMNYLSPQVEILLLSPEASLMQASEGQPESLTILDIEYDD